MPRGMRNMSLRDSIKAAEVLEGMVDDNRVIETQNWKALTVIIAHSLGKDSNEVSDSTIRTICNELEITVKLTRKYNNFNSERISDIEKLCEEQQHKYDMLLDHFDEVIRGLNALEGHMKLGKTKPLPAFKGSIKGDKIS